jgi:carboxyl-terminal processing protease
MRKWWLAAFLFLSISYLLEAHEQDLLKGSDITRIMQQILAEHVDKKEMTSQILHSALLRYIDHFDPHRMYLLESEAAPYINLSPAQLNESIEQYKRNDFSGFKHLNQVIQASIQRSRKIRQGLESEVKNNLFHPSPKEEKESLTHTEEGESFPRTTDQLKERITQNLGSFINDQKRRFGDAMTLQRKEQILHSYEERLQDFENQYLYQDEKGEPLPSAEQENLFTIHVLKALASSLDSHTSFYQANEAYDIRVRLQKERHRPGFKRYS